MFDINKMVKRTMGIFEVENVRGGAYDQMTLTP
jgi:hypothetical protein